VARRRSFPTVVSAEHASQSTQVIDFDPLFL
jgi:hypothetical protein